MGSASPVGPADLLPPSEVHRPPSVYHGAVDRFGCFGGVLVVLLGCGPTPIDDGDGTGSASGASTTALASTDASASSTVSDVTTSEATDATTRGDTTGTETGPGSTDGTETGEAACPPPEDVAVTFSVSPDETFSATCTVASVTGDETTTTIGLDCDGTEATLVVTITPPSAGPHVFEGELVQLDHVVDQIFWTNRWVALRSAGGESDQLLLGAVDGSTLDPPGTTLDAFLGGGSYGSPTVAVADGLCMPEDDSCGPLERLALDFTLARLGTRRAFDHGTAFVDVLAFGFAYTVEQATQYPSEQTCDDNPPAWFDLAMIWFPSD